MDDDGQESAVPRDLRGRYLVRVGALSVHGEARGQIEAVLSEPTEEARARAAAGRGGVVTTIEDVAFIGGLPGELAEVEVIWTLPRPGRRRRARHISAPRVRLIAVREPSTDRVAPRCNVFGECGGCQLQHLAYPKQLVWKTMRVREALVAAALAAPDVAPALGCEPPWGYRNHMRFSVDREGRAGLTARGSRHILPLVTCPIANASINAALEAFGGEELARPQMLARCGESTGQVMFQPAPSMEVRERLTARGEEVCDDAMEERLLGVPFRIRPSSFFQTNTRQANRMAELVLARMPQGGDVTLVDAYCGVGTFARLLAPRAGSVIAIEESASAIRDARWNLRDAVNVTIVQGKVEDVLPEMAQRLDGFVIDPPRAGCQRAVLDALAARRVPTVVYVSCDPDTLARDLAHLCNARQAYRLVSVQPLDMFPQTAHIENVATLEAIAGV
jgi:23S rRNA (uracil1939-C5)-methyltransferase